MLAGVPDGSSIRVDGDYVIDCVAVVCIGPQCAQPGGPPAFGNPAAAGGPVAPGDPVATVEVLGSFLNRSLVPGDFDWLDGRLLLSGAAVQSVEAGGIEGERKA